MPEQRPARAPRRRGHRFFLSPYEDAAFTRCPRCARAPTRVRKVFLVVHVEPRLLVVLNKTGKLCERCDLLIVKKADFESLLTYSVEQIAPELVGNEYLVLGTLDKADGRQVRAGGAAAAWVAERVKVFREVLNFEPAPAWVWEPPEAGARP